MIYEPCQIRKEAALSILDFVPLVFCHLAPSLLAGSFFISVQSMVKMTISYYNYLDVLMELSLKKGVNCNELSSFVSSLAATTF